MIHDGQINIFVKGNQIDQITTVNNITHSNSESTEKRQAHKWKGTSVNKSVENIWYKKYISIIPIYKKQI